MGYVLAHGLCFSCKRSFGFHPNKVPSIPINGVREPICADCVEVANPRRIANGLPPIDILPGAYEAADENDIDWDG